MWSVVIAVAEQIPWTYPAQNRLVEIIQALKGLPGSKTLDLDDWGKLEIWSGLPLLGPAMTEHSYLMIGSIASTQTKFKSATSRRPTFRAASPTIIGFECLSGYAFR
ncbi:hypothetical protein CVT25_002180 [Psilocybe cyanescens]|uniref:Uncharacterized protein n=1 Tax=Psilocybe cyanescens TaxID=93625 RepID=A0A409X064_PSICY|nr:hypothetical protein CVT25_002180 [Psilocybe cyanescens]